MSTYSRGCGFKSSQVLGFSLFLSLSNARSCNDTDFLITLWMLSMDVLLALGKTSLTRTDLTKTTIHLCHRLKIVRKAITKHFKMALWAHRNRSLVKGRIISKTYPDWPSQIWAWMNPYDLGLPILCWHILFLRKANSINFIFSWMFLSRTPCVK